jgi:ABC-type sugar transport system ATPase subunit
VYRGISVYKNIELPLLRRKISASDRRHRIEEALELLNLQDQADIDSSQLDNVSRQKVSVARAISYHPDIILFDEPMTNIDANSRVQFSHFFKELSKKLNQVIVYVTHDQTEAMTLADQIALMEDGRIVQCDEPRALYNQPEDIFGGWFLGNPGMNFIDGQCEHVNGKAAIISNFFQSPLHMENRDLSGQVTVGIRPEHIKLSKTSFGNAVAAKVQRKSITVGGQFLFVIQVDNVEIKAKISDPPVELMNAQSVWIELPAEHIVLFNENQNRVHAQIAK